MSYTKGKLYCDNLGNIANKPLPDKWWKYLLPHRGLIGSTYGKKNDLANAAELVRRWNSHDALLEVCEEAEWVAMDNLAKFRCPTCMNSKENGHRHDCKLKAAIAAARE